VSTTTVNEPRVAVLSMTALGSACATGQLLATLFRDWSPESLFQVYTLPPAGDLAGGAGPGLKGRHLTELLPLPGRLVPALRLADGICLNARAVRDRLAAFAADVLYLRVVGHPLYYLRLARWLADELDLPLVCHVMDDYELLYSLSRSASERRLLAPRFAALLRAVLARASARLAISDSMSRAFRVRYGYEFVAVHNGVDPEIWPERPVPAATGRAARAFRLVIAGGIDPKKEGRTVSAAAHAVHRLNRAGRGPVELVLNVPAPSMTAAERLAQGLIGVRVQPFVSAARYPGLLQDADLLVVARDFHEQARGYTQHSFQNKLPEYMASGTPVLCVAPPWAETVALLRDTDAGLCVTRLEETDILDAIEAVRSAPLQAAARAVRARELALTRFDACVMRARLRECLSEAARGGARGRKGVPERPAVHRAAGQPGGAAPG
jgi:glycosyltransferase involved in cell wall biosynthesis